MIIIYQKFIIRYLYMIPVKQMSHGLGPWNFKFCQSGLSPSAEIEQLSQKCKLFRSPSIIFGKNFCEIQMKEKGFKLLYNAEEALKFINYEWRQKNFYKKQEDPKVNGISFIPEKLQIKHAEQWKNLQKPKDIEITQIQQSSDSFYVTPFKGHIEGNVKITKTQQSVIPLHKLGPQNQIKFYQQGSLYEDELDDNGLIQYQYKFRCMEQNWFGLIRCYARVDDVVIIILDTRIYWEVGKDQICRQFNVKQAKWNEIKEKGFDLSGSWSTNPHQSHLVYEHLDECFVENQYIEILK